MKSIKSILFLLLLLFCINPNVLQASPSPELDQSFAIGTGAGFPAPGSPFWPQVQSVAVQPDGKVLAGGQSLFTNFNGTAIRALCRINPNGSLDTAFQANLGDGPTVTTGAGEINRIIVQPDGKILICGDFNTVNGFARNSIARLNADGSVDASFIAGGGGIGGTLMRYVADMALQPDGKVLIGGGFNNYLGTARSCLARLNSDGSLDTSFHHGFPAGLGSTAIIRSLGVQGDGKVFVGGTFTNWLGMPTPGIVRLYDDGTLDTSFVPRHTNPFVSVQALHVVGDGSVLVGGFIEGTDSGITRNFARLNSDGSLDTAYPSGSGIKGWVGDIQPWPEGGYLVAGRFREASGQPRGELVYINPAGNIDLNFDPEPYSDSAGDIVHIYSTAVTPDGKIVFGGWLTNYPNNTLLNGQDYSGLGRLIGGYTGGPGKLQFTAASLVANENMESVTISVSRFGGVTGAVSVNYATASGSATAGPDFGATSGTLSWADGEAGTKSFTVSIIGNSTPESLETFTVNLSSPSGGATVGAIPTVTVTIIDDDSAPAIFSHPQDTSVYIGYPATFGVIVGPGLPATYQWQSNGVAIANATNVFFTLNNVQPNVEATYSVVVSNSNGSTESSGATLTVKIPAGLPDPDFVTPGSSFSLGFNSDVYDLAFQSNGQLIAVGSFSQYGGVSGPNNIARLNTDGTRDTGFPFSGIGANGVIQIIEAYPDGKWLIAGNFSQYSSTSRDRVARLNADGTLDSGLASANILASTVNAALPLPDGGALVGDSSVVRRLLPTGAPDSSFTTTTLPGPTYALALRADGKILAAPFRSSAPSGTELVLLNTDGTRDNTFPSIRFSGTVKLTTLLDGRILVTGAFPSMTVNGVSIPAPRLAVLFPDGTVDTSFDVGTGTTESIIDAFVQADGRILLGGAFTSWNGMPVGRFVRLLPNGQLDSTFITGTGANNNFVRAVTMSSAGVPAIGGSFTMVNGQPRGKIALLTYGAGSVQLTTGEQEFIESAGSITVSVERVAGSRGELTVDYATLSGEATSGSDFTPANGTFTWADGESGIKSFNVTLNNDASVEADETFSVGLSNLAGDGAYGLYSNQVITILDDESTPRITLHPVDTTSTEDVSVAFSAEAFSPLDFSYQWRSNGVTILNATNPVLTLLNVQSNYAASYSVRVSNVNGFTDSSNATLTVIASPTRRDTTFNASFNGTVRTVYPLGDGRVMVGGDFTQPRNKIVLLNGDGSVDTSFTHLITGAGTVNVYDIERDSRGRWLIAGQFTSFGGITSNVVRLNSDFTIDQSFVIGMGSAPNGLVRDVTVGPDGKIWIAGGFSSVGGPYGLQYLARLNDDGTPDLSFLPRANGSVSRVVPLPDGKALIAGAYSSYDGFGGAVRRINADGTVDRTYSPNFSGGQVFDIIPAPDGGIFACGTFTSPSSRIAKLDASGAPQTSFLGGAIGNAAVNGVALQSNGRLIGVGNFATFGIHSNRFTRVDVNGFQDNSIFTGTGFNNEAFCVALQPNGNIWVGGSFTQYKGLSAPYLVRLVGDEPAVSIGTQPFDRVVPPGQNTTFTVTAVGTGALSYQWFKDGAPLSNIGIVSGADSATLTLTGISASDEGDYTVVVSNGSGASAESRPANLLVQSAPQIVAQSSDVFVPLGGKLFLQVEAQGAPTLAYEWFKDGSAVGSDMPFYVLANAEIGASGDYWVVVSNSFGSVTSSIVAVTVQATPASAAPGFFTDAGTANTSDTIYALQPLPDGRLLAGGSFGSVRTNGATTVFRQNLALFTSIGMADAFSPNPASQITDLVRQRDGKMLVSGYFTSISNITRRYIARFNADFTFDTNFHNAIGTGPDQRVDDIALQADGKILLAGNFSNVNGLPNTRAVVRLNQDGSLDDSFVSRAAQYGSATLVEVLPDGKILLLCNGQYDGHISALHRLYEDGSVDSSFIASTDGAITAFAIQTNGAIVVGGTFTTFNGVQRTLLARLAPNGQIDTDFMAGVTNFTASNQSVIRTIAIQDNGKILAGGSFLSFGPFRNGLARFNSDGTPDESFVFQQGIGDDYNANVWKVALFADGRIAVGGRFATWEGVNENCLVILNGDPVALGFATHPLDQFVPEGTTVQFSAQAVGTPTIGYQWFKGAAPLSDGGNVSGATTPTLTITSATLANADIYSLRISNSTGERFSLPAELYILGAPFFREQPMGGTFYVSNSIALRPTVLGLDPVSYQWLLDETNLIAGATNSALSFTNLSLTNAGMYQLVASNALGVVTSEVATINVIMPPAWLSSTFPHPAGANSSITSIAPDGDGRLVIGGSFSQAGLNGNQTSISYLARLETNGTVDATFNPAPNSSILQVVRDSAGGYLVSGYFNSIGGATRSSFARLNADGTADTAFHTNLGSGPQFAPDAICVQSDGKILLGGSFGSVSGQSYPSVVRLNANGSIDSSFRLNLPFSQTVRSIAIRPDGRIYIGGSITISNRQNLIRLESNGNVDLSFDANLNSQVEKVALASDGGVFAGGFFSTVNGLAAPNFARLNPDGSLHAGFPSSAPNGSVSDIRVQQNGKVIIIGQFSAVGPNRARIARLNVDGTLDTSFDPGTGFGFSTVSALGLESDGRIWVAGNFTSYNNNQVNRLLLLVGDPVTTGGTNEPTFASWATLAGLTPGNNGPDQDPDGDSILNAFEFYFGTSPTNSASSHLPTSGSVEITGETFPAITFIRAKNASGVTLLPQASSDVSFSNSLGTEVHSVVDLGNGLEEVTIRSSVNDATAPIQFLRIQLSL